MIDYTFIETFPGKDDFHFFDALQDNLYPEEFSQLGKHQLTITNLTSCVIALKDNKPVGRYAFYENSLLSHKKQKTASIGSYECVDNHEVSTLLLNHAKTKAIEYGYSFLLGPLDGSTWSNFRFSKDNKNSNFFLEPYHHIYYNQQFLDNGFNVAAEYMSNLDTQLNFDSNSLKSKQEKFESLGLTFRNIDLNDFENDLHKIANFSNEAFSENFLFTPSTEIDFVTKYLPLKHFVDPELVILVEDKKKDIQALAFSIKDLYDPTGKTVVYKTMGRRKLNYLEGIGQFLVAKSNEVAVKKGYEKSIQAFMIDDNPSAKISEKVFDATTYKRYYLYGTAL